MSKILEIKASTWTREDLPGYHVRYALPDDAVVTLDGMQVFPVPASQMAKVTPPAVGPIEGEGGGKGSVILQALTGGFMQTDHAGNLVYRDGRIHTVATPNDPWPAAVAHDTAHDGLLTLLNFQANHNNRPDKLYVDGLPHGPAGSDPGVRYSSTARPGYLTLEFSPPVGVKVEAPAATDTEPARITINPPAGNQVTAVLRGPTIVTLPNQPAPVVPGRMGFIRLTDMAGQQMPTGTVDVRDGEGQLIYSDLANGFGCNFVVGEFEGSAEVIFAVGETITVECLGLTGDVLMDYRTAAWG